MSPFENSQTFRAEGNDGDTPLPRRRGEDSGFAISVNTIERIYKVCSDIATERDAYRSQVHELTERIAQLDNHLANMLGEKE